MAVELNQPITQPAVAIPEKVYNEIWLTALHIQATPDRCLVGATVQPSRTLEDGSKELSDQRYDLDVKNLWADITETEVQAMNTLVTLVKNRLGI